jgi:serine/threonine protein kinase/DNA-binding winged helix-turn-helix (wHTH) protein
MAATPQPASLFRYRFGTAEFDAARFELRVSGLAVEIQRKPLEILSCLLSHAGEVVTKDELLETVWEGRPTVENVIANAVTKLRGALGDGNAERVVTQPRVGYRFEGPFERVAVGRTPLSSLELVAGAQVPGRPNFVLDTMIGHSTASEVWLGRQARTRETRVFKFSPDGGRLAALKREATLSRLLLESFGERKFFARLIDWNFETPPFFLEYEYGGQNLLEWAETAGHLASLPTSQRLALFLRIVDGVAAAHSVGVLHKDLKPANVLIAPGDGGEWHVRLTDFGSSRLLEPERLAELGITQLGMTMTAGALGDATSGTPLYLAPELISGAPPTVRSDVYALGVMLYQFLVGDFRKPLTAGWEADIADPMLREDIALSAAGEPDRRLQSATLLAERLRNLDRRREETAQLRGAEARALQAEKRLERARARRPWIVLAACALGVGATVSVYLAYQAVRERNRAEHQSEIAESVSRFLGEDLLARSNPYRSGKPDESLLGAIRASSADIDRRFGFEPAVAARLHQTMAKALDGRNDWDSARKEYEQAANLWIKADGPLSQDAIIANLQQVQMLVRSYRGGSLEPAEKLFAEQEALIQRVGTARPELAVWRASAHGMIGLIKNDLATAADEFRIAAGSSEQLPEIFDLQTRLTFKQRQAFTFIRLGDGQQAERLFRELVAGYGRLKGPDSAEVLMVRMNLVQALMIQREHAAAIAEAEPLYPRMVATLGPDHEMTLQLLTTRAQSHGSLEQWDAAIEDGMAVHDLAVAKLGPKSFFAIATLTDVATAQCRAARLGEGLTNAEASHRESLAAFGSDAALTQAVAYTRASCLIPLNRIDEADELLAGINSENVAALAGDPHWGANVELAKAQIAFLRKDFAAARKHLDAAKPGFSVPKAEAYQVRAVTMLDASLQARATANASAAR